ncbi:hypothetical protein QQF64_003266 [Cirrhinus molitorella]|uniref:Reverse transcriptase RNase H-like domain-containing protein n=1 Tax=Cirrhinus molitorella TaxID=172907 RepID=A0ABR3MKV5_9TELE
MDFMLRASISIHIPSRTVVLGNDPLLIEELDGKEMEESESRLLFMEVPPSALQEKIEEACLNNEEKEQLTGLLEDFADLFDGHLGRTSLTEHSIDTGNAKPQHLDDLKEVLSHLKSAGLTIKLAKCQFCRKELTFLGYRVCPHGVLPDQDKVKAVLDFKTPVTVKQVRQFLGLSGYYRRFIQDYARHAEPLFALTKNEAPFVWDSACQDAMDLLKQKLTSAPILNFPDFTLPFFIHADACDAGLGAALMQRDLHGREVAVAYASRALHKSEKPYSTPEKECLAVIWALEHFRPYIEGLHVTIFTDHSGLKWLMARPNPTGRLARWSLRLQDFDFEVVHKPGSGNKVPDALSRNPLPDDVPPMDLLPDYAVIGGLDLRTLSSVTLIDRSHVRQLQLDDPITGDLLHKMEAALQRDNDEDVCSQYSIHDGLLYFNDPKSACGIHPLKCLKLYAPSSLRSKRYLTAVLPRPPNCWSPRDNQDFGSTEIPVFLA